MGKIKVMAIGDIHGDTGLVRKLAKKAEEEKVDIVILAGDLTFAEQSTENLIGPFIKGNRKVLILAGNHESSETTEFLSHLYENTIHLHGKGIKEGEVGIFGAGLTNMGIYAVEDNEFKTLLEKAYKEIKGTKKRVMVTHMHPLGSKSEFSGFQGSRAIRDMILKTKPEIMFNAHIHEAGGIEEKIGKTKVINVSRKEKIIEI